jgi:hypothetical protein
MTKQTEFIPFMGVVEFDDSIRVNETTNKPQKETGIYMKTKQTLSEMKAEPTLSDKVLAYMKANPEDKPARVAHQCGVRLGYVYSVRHAARLAKTSGIKKIQTNTVKVKEYIKNNPNASAKEVAKALELKPHQVYQTVFYIKSKAKKAKVTKTSPTKEVKDSVNHPPHYKVGGIETIDFIEAKSLGYNLGNVVKYITRADHKGNKIEDLKKGAWYLLREIEVLEKAK